MDLIGKATAVTGHRPQHLSGSQRDWIIQELDRLIEKMQPSWGITGMALGVDTWYAEACLRAGVPFHAYVPFTGQEQRWRADDKTRYWQLLEKAEVVQVICDPPVTDQDAIQAMFARNEAMVDDAEVLIAVWNGKRSGGTFGCYNYALKKDRPIVHANPKYGSTVFRRRVVVAQQLPLRNA